MIKPENTTRKSIITNFQFVYLNDKTKNYQFIKDQEEIDVMMANDQVSDKDVIVELTNENIQVAQSINKVILD